MYNNEYTFFLVFDRDPIDTFSLRSPTLTLSFLPLPSPRICVQFRWFFFTTLYLLMIRSHRTLGPRARFYRLHSDGNPEALFCAGLHVIFASERARARALRRHVHKCIYTYNYIDCTADEFADCTIYDYIGSIKRNENARTTCHTRVTPRFSPSIRSSLSVVDLRYLEDSLQSIKRNSRSKRFREKC